MSECKKKEQKYKIFAIMKQSRSFELITFRIEEINNELKSKDPPIENRGTFCEPRLKAGSLKITSSS